MKRPTLLRVEQTHGATFSSDRYNQAAANGFDGVEWALGGWGPATANASGLGAKTETSRVHAVAARCSTTKIDAALEEVMQLLGGTAKVGASCLNLTIPPVGAERAAVAFKRYQQALDFAGGLFVGLRYEAERTGVALALEAATGGVLCSPVELRELIDDAHSWAVGACVDVACVSSIGPPADWITTLGRRIHSVRTESRTSDILSDGTDRAPACLNQVASALEAAAYDGPVIVRKLTG